MVHHALNSHFLQSASSNIQHADLHYNKQIHKFPFSNLSTKTLIKKPKGNYRQVATQHIRYIKLSEKLLITNQVPGSTRLVDNTIFIASFSKKKSLIINHIKQKQTPSSNTITKLTK